MGFKAFISDIYSVKSTVMSVDDVYNRFGGYGIKSAGVTVNTTTAMQHATVFACIRDKAESIGQLPVRLFRMQRDGTEVEIKKGREYRILTKQPNDFMTMQDLLQMYVTCRESYGKFYAYIVRNDLGSIAEIIPFRHQGNVTPNMDMNGNLYYTYVTNDNKPMMAFAGGDVIHIKGNTLDGFTGLSPISYNASAIGLGMAQENHMAKLCKNGAMPKGLLETPNVFQDAKNATRLREEFDDRYAGTENSGKTVLLENGLKFSPLTISPADSELLLSRQYSQQQICGIFRVPPRRIGASTVAKQADIEQENKDYYVNSLMPQVVSFEYAMNIITPDNIRVQVDERGFTRGDLASTVEALGKAFSLSAINMNEFREGIGYQSVEFGEYRAIDTNNITLGTLDQVESLQAEQRALAMAGANNQKKPVKEDENET